jgi:hypothetical protein
MSRTSPHFSKILVTSSPTFPHFSRTKRLRGFGEGGVNSSEARASIVGMQEIASWNLCLLVVWSFFYFIFKFFKIIAVGG